jgi:hypothetical protein
MNPYNSYLDLAPDNHDYKDPEMVNSMGETEQLVADHLIGEA